VGSCFEVASGVLVTAWHVVDDLGCGLDDAVMLDALAGGPTLRARVDRLDPMHDLAVLRADASLGGQVVGLAATDLTPLDAAVVVTGVPAVDDPDHSYRHLDATGKWTGGTTRDDEVPLGRLEARALMRGMSGAPVRVIKSDVVVGVVSGRYNSADGWLRDSVWIARIEDLEPLLRDLAPGRIQRMASGSGPSAATFIVDERQVRLTAEGLSAQGAHQGVSRSLAERVRDLRRHRSTPTTRDPLIGPLSVVPSHVALSGLGDLLADAFLPSDVSAALRVICEGAERTHRQVWFGVTAELFGMLPWEALADPLSRRPLALCPLINVYRRHSAAAPASVPGPLRILVAIASPEADGGELLDYERELRNVLAAVRGARQSQARVRIVPFATTGAIWAALKAEPVHVLHLTGHGSPGHIVLEHDDGRARQVDADIFVNEAIPPGHMPVLITVSACFSNSTGVEMNASFAARLIRRGATAVIATETSVTDVYATRLMARVYANLAGSDTPEVVAAVCDARRAVQTELIESTEQRVRELAALDEWATVTVLCDGPTVLPIGPHQPAPAVAPGGRLGGMLARDAGDFVGRRREQRRWPKELLAAGTAGKVLCGIGGVGKTTLAAELARRVSEYEPSRLLVGIVGSLTVDGLLARVSHAVRRSPFAKEGAPELMEVLDYVARVDVPWTERWDLLRETVLDVVPLLVVLDNFEDNLQRTETAVSGWRVADDGLAALLGAWAAAPGRGRLLVTCRHPFDLPDDAQQGLEFHQIGPLTQAETRKLMWALPALDCLDRDQAEQVWRLVGGHPRALEYLDALLNAGKGRFTDITIRLRRALEYRLGRKRTQQFLQDVSLDQAVSETVALAADDVLLGDLLADLAHTPGARRFLLGASVYRRPVDVNGLLYQVGLVDETAASTPDRDAAARAVTSLLAGAGLKPSDLAHVDQLPDTLVPELAAHFAVLKALPTPPRHAPYQLDRWIERCRAASLLDVTDGLEPRFSVHRWTAEALSERHPDPLEVKTAHRAAADYWRWRVQVWPQDADADIDDLLEARHHLLEAGELDVASDVTETACVMLRTRGAWEQAAALINDTLRRLPADRRRRAFYYGQLGILAQMRGDYGQAEELYREALAVSERLGDEAGMSSGYHHLGLLAQVREDYDHAEVLYRQSLEIDERLGDEAGVAKSAGQLGILAQLRRDYDQAETFYHQSLEISERLGQDDDVTTSYHQLGVLAQLREDYGQAETFYRRSLEISERLGAQRDMSITYYQLGMLAADVEDYVQAEMLCRQALEIAVQLGAQEIISKSYYQLGRLAEQQGDFGEADRLYRQSLEISQQLGDRFAVASALSQLGVAAAKRGDISVAITFHVQALSFRMQVELPGSAIDVLGLLEARRLLGVEAFETVVLESIDAESLTNLNDLLQTAAPPDENS
jgi:tetratricopeptide (TPR) repeat protein